MKKAQVTIFIIFAIFIVVSLMSYFVYKGNLLDIKYFSKDDIIYNKIMSCIDKTSKDAILYISENGGYYEIPNESTDNHIPYYFYKRKNIMPSKEEVETELENYVNDMLFFCNKNFIEFPEYEVKQGEVESKVIIEREKINFNIDYPISVRNGNVSYSYNNFEKEFEVRLGLIHSLIENFTNEQLEIPKDICLTCLEEIAFENNLSISISDYKEDVVFGIIDPESKLNDRVLEFYFANEYE